MDDEKLKGAAFPPPFSHRNMTEPSKRKWGENDVAIISMKWHDLRQSFLQRKTLELWIAEQNFWLSPFHLQRNGISPTTRKIFTNVCGTITASIADFPLAYANTSSQFLFSSSSTWVSAWEFQGKKKLNWMCENNCVSPEGTRSSQRSFETLLVFNINRRLVSNAFCISRPNFF